MLDLINPGSFTPKEYQRAVAAYYYITHDFTVATAARLYKLRFPNCTMRADALRKFIKRWGMRVLSGHGVCDMPRPGRAKKVPTCMLDALYQAIHAGRPSISGMVCLYASWAEIMRVCKVAQEIKLWTGCSDRTLQNSLVKQYPDVMKMTVYFKTHLTDAQKAARLECAQKLKEVPMTQLLATFWIDAATIYVDPKKRTVVCSKQLMVKDTWEHPACPRGKAQVVKIKYFACVNAVAGPVALVVATGSTGLREWRLRNGQHLFMVSMWVLRCL